MSSAISAGGTILVTGACGYLGSVLIRELAADQRFAEHSIRILDNLSTGGMAALTDLPAHRYEFVEGDILNPAAVRVALDGVVAVVHLAAVVSTPINFDNRPVLEQVNHWGTEHLVEECLHAGVERFVYASSASVYGVGGPYTESAPCRPFGFYAQSKLRAEHAVLAARDRGLRPTVLRIGSVFGQAPVMRFDTVANRFAYLAGVGRSLSVYGTGDQRRPFVHARDASSALRFTLASSLDDDTYNVVGCNPSVLEIAEDLQKSRPGLRTWFTEQDIATHLSFEVDGGAFAAAGWRPLVSLEAGLTELAGRFASVTTPDQLVHAGAGL